MLRGFFVDATPGRGMGFEISEIFDAFGPQLNTTERLKNKSKKIQV